MLFHTNYDFSQKLRFFTKILIFDKKLTKILSFQNMGKHVAKGKITNKLQSKKNKKLMQGGNQAKLKGKTIGAKADVKQIPKGKVNAQRKHGPKVAVQKVRQTFFHLNYLQFFQIIYETFCQTFVSNNIFKQFLKKISNIF